MQKTNKDFASICILAWQRPEMLIECIDSLHATIDYPCEIIVNVDGSKGVPSNAEEIAISFFKANKISKLILTSGENRGVGRSLKNCLNAAEGEYLFKIDSDIVFEKEWLSTSVHALQNNPDIASISLFNYNNYDPKDERFRILETRPDCNIVTDFVSSSYGFRSESLTEFPFNGADDGYHQRIAQERLLAITKRDYVKNTGFGRSSVYLTFDSEGIPSKTQTYSNPLLFSPLT